MQESSASAFALKAVFEEGKNRKPEIIDVVECTQCGVCVSLCPAKAITITKS